MESAGSGPYLVGRASGRSGSLDEFTDHGVGHGVARQQQLGDLPDDAPGAFEFVGPATFLPLREFTFVDPSWPSTSLFRGVTKKYLR